MDFQRGSKFPCPVCGIPYGVCDTEERTWRHLNIFQYPTYVHAREPRIKCNEHGKKTVDLPWARKGSGLMCSLYHLDSYKREYIELSRYKGESRGGFANLLHLPHGTGDAHA